ncbi:MAG: alpha/beta hydrolase [Sphingopyxis sp.]|nr:alpha/beta hydrolase [Sphingopyxis sp.]
MVSRLSLLRTALVALFAAALAFAPAQAADGVDLSVETIVTYDVVEEDAEEDTVEAPGMVQRHAATPALQSDERTGPRFGPFTVVDGSTARMVGGVGSATPRQFAAMLAAHPALKRIELVDCPGSLDEEANLRLARAIRRAGLATHVPDGGSVRSGAVELFLAGTTRSAAPTAEFGVHSWRDEDGREARDYPANDPVHAEYLSYYREMGMDAATAQAFYAMTNASSFDDLQYLTRADIARYVALN